MKTIEMIYCPNFNAPELFEKLEFRCKVRFFAQGNLKLHFCGFGVFLWHKNVLSTDY